VIKGLDVSSVQGGILAAEWQALAKQGVRFVVAKCGNGNDGFDRRWSANVGMAKTAGMIVGVYHFPFVLPATPEHPTRDPVVQARAHFNYCQGLGKAAGDLPACCDVEWPTPEHWGKPLPGIDGAPVVTRQSLVDGFSAYMDEYERLQGRPMLLYSYPYFLRALQPIPLKWTTRPLWLANYEPHVKPEPPWAGWSLMQTSGGGGRLPGGVPVDTDVCVDEATLRALAQLPACA